MKNKFYKFKKWLTLKEVAKHLSIEFDEAISVADILQLVIDQHLKISVDFPHDWSGKLCDITTDKEKANQFEEVIGIEGELVKLYKYEKCSETEYINVLPEVFYFEGGIYEVKMIGNSKIDVKFLLETEIYSTGTDVFNLSGFYVLTTDGKVIERQSKIEYPPYCNIETKKLIQKSFYYPCGGLAEIEGAKFVIQTKHLDELLSNLNDEQKALNKDITGKSETSYLNIIQALKDELLNGSQFSNQSELINHLSDKYQGYTGLSEANLREKFAKANLIK